MLHWQKLYPKLIRNDLLLFSFCSSFCIGLSESMKIVTRWLVVYYKMAWVLFILTVSQGLLKEQLVKQFRLEENELGATDFLTVVYI